MKDYSINNIVDYRKLDWKHSRDFLYLTDVPNNFEPFQFFPDFFSFGIIENGDLAVDIDNFTYEVKQDSFVICRPNQVFKTVSVEPGTKGAFILFNKRFITSLSEDMSPFTQNIFLNNQFGSFKKLYSSDHNKLASLFSDILGIISRASSERWDFTAKKLMSALINETDLILNTYKTDSTTNFSANEIMLVSKFIDLVNSNFLTRRDVAFYTNNLNISNSLLYKIIRKHLNTTPKDIINEKLLNEAKYYLKFSNKNITEISHHLAFSDIFSFSKYFKKQTGLSPTDFQNQ